MRYLPLLVLSSFAFAQQQQKSVTGSQTPDLNGNYTYTGYTVASEKSAKSSARTEYAPNTSGALVPRETVKEKVIREDANGRVVERYIVRHDQDGNPGPAEKVVIEEKKSGNVVTVNALVYRGDINGNMQPAERTVSQTVTQGAVTTTETTLERKGLDGMLVPAEKIHSTTVQQSKTQQFQTVSKMFRDSNGNYYEGSKDTIDRKTSADGQVVENRAQYVEGRLTEQAVAKTVPGPNGAATTTVDIYSIHGSGTNVATDGKMAIKEQQQIVQQPGPGGQMTQMVVIRRPTVSEPGRLGPAQIQSKSVCQGSCLPGKN